MTPPSQGRPDHSRKSRQKRRKSPTEKRWNAPWSAKRCPVRAAQKRVKAVICEAATTAGPGVKIGARREIPSMAEILRVLRSSAPQAMSRPDAGGVRDGEPPRPAIRGRAEDRAQGR